MMYNQKLLHRRMKKFFLAMTLFCASLTMQAQDTKTIEILHTNDTHSCILPLNPNLADTVVAGRGGFLRRLAMIEAERRQNPDLLLFDSGDFSQGSPFYSIYKGDVEVELMNRMGYDAATIGNHEFDFGLENMARLFRLAKFPIVCANYDFTGTPVEGLVKPYVIIKRGGLRVGVFGVCPEMKGLVDSTKCEGAKYIDPVKTADEVAHMLKHKKHCDMVVCLSHLGWEMAQNTDDHDMIAANHDIDIVLGGHSHTYFPTLQYVKNADGKQIPDDQNGKHAVFVGKILVNMSVDQQKARQTQKNH